MRQSSLTSRLFCTRCHNGLPDQDWNSPEMRVCAACEARFRVFAFPALLRERRVAERPQSVEEGDANCFYHPRKKAVTPCDHCGRFLCSLCDIEFRGQRWCPACLESGKRKRTIRTLENSRTHYDTIALSLATLPALGIWPSLFCSPMAIYVAIRHWKAPASVVPRTRIRYYLALGFGGVQVVAWIWGIAYLLSRR